MAGKAGPDLARRSMAACGASCCTSRSPGAVSGKFACTSRTLWTVGQKRRVMDRLAEQIETRHTRPVPAAWATGAISPPCFRNRRCE